MNLSFIKNLDTFKKEMYNIEAARLLVRETKVVLFWSRLLLGFLLAPYPWVISLS